MMTLWQRCSIFTLASLFIAGAMVSLAFAKTPYSVAPSRQRNWLAESVRNRKGAESVAQGEVNKEFAAQLQSVWETVRQHFFDPNLNGVDWNKIGDSYRARLPQIRTKAEFESFVNQMLGELHASHTAYYTDDDIEYEMLPAVFRGDLRGHQVEQIGVLGQRTGGEYVVAAILNGSPAEAAGILPGDHLLKVDGRPFTSAGSFRGKAGTPVSIELRRAGERATRTVTVVPVKQNVLRSLLDATVKSAQVLDVGGKRLGYLHLWTMATPAFLRALDDLALNKLYATDGLILDLREGYGGTPWGYADVFFRPDVTWGQQERDSKPYTMHTGYSRPMVVLIDSGTRSSKEYLAYQFKVSHRAVLVGERTAKAFLGANVFPIGKDGLLELAVEDLSLDGKHLEGAGVAPDVEVAPASNSMPRDRQMARAEQILLDSIRHAPAESGGNGAVVAH